MKQLLITLTITFISIASIAQPGHDKLEQAMAKKYGEPGMAKFNKFAMGKIEAEYAFPQTIHMHFIDYNKGKKKDENDIVFHYNEEAETFGFSSSEMNDGQKGTIIYDHKNNAMVMLNDGNNTAFAMNTKSMGMESMYKKYQQKHEKTDIYKNVKCNKTSGDRTIAGYSCYKYHCVDEEENTSGDIWVTEEQPINIGKSASMTPWAMYLNGVGDVEGTMMAGKFYKNDKLDSEFEVTKIENNSSYSIETGKYKQMDMFGR